jgi:hypothetical protein
MELTCRRRVSHLFILARQHTGFRECKTIAVNPNSKPGSNRARRVAISHRSRKPQLIDGPIAELDIEGDDLARKPYIDEAIAAVERGESVTLKEHRTHMATF